jgi:hypothetical protein
MNKCLFCQPYSALVVWVSVLIRVKKSFHPCTLSIFIKVKALVQPKFIYDNVTFCFSGFLIEAINFFNRNFKKKTNFDGNLFAVLGIKG